MGVVPGIRLWAVRVRLVGEEKLRTDWMQVILGTPTPISAGRGTKGWL